MADKRTNVADPEEDFGDVIEPGTWGDIEEKEFSGEFPVLNRGVYGAYLADHEIRTGKDSGNDYLSLEFVVDKDPDLGVDFDHHVWDSWFFTPKSIGQTKSKASALGVEIPGDTPFAEVIDVMNETLFDFHNQTCRLRVKVSRYTGTGDNGEPIKKLKNDVQRILPAEAAV